VARFNGTGYEFVGSASFSEGSADYFSFTLDKSVTPAKPYVSFSDGNNGSALSVMTFDSSAGNWSYVGRCDL